MRLRTSASFLFTQEAGLWGSENLTRVGLKLQGRCAQDAAALQL